MKGIVLIAVLIGMPAALTLGDAKIAQAQSVSGAPIRCPIDNKYYQLRAPDQWTDHEQVARRTQWLGRSGRLAVVNSKAVQDWLYNQFSSLRPGYVLVGGYREGNNGAAVGWVWTNGQPVSMGSSVWEPGEPNNTANKERYLSMNFRANGKFNDISGGGAFVGLYQY